MIPQYASSKYVSRIAVEATAAGSHWFDPSTLRFFRSRVARTAWSVDGVRWLFVSSEQGPGMRRRYTVRQYVAPRDINSVGDFQEHATLKQAQAALARELREQSKALPRAVSAQGGV